MDIKYFAYRERNAMACGRNCTPSVKIVAEETDFIPSFQTVGSAGADLRSKIDITLQPNEIALVPVGFKCEIPAGYHAKILSRSSMGKKGIIIPNGPGLIDSDYRDEIKVLLLNLSGQPFVISKYDRIAQWLLEKNVSYAWQQVSELESSARAGGFGSTGVS
jgi:dUTP pyrophosphatase